VLAKIGVPPTMVRNERHVYKHTNCTVKMEVGDKDNGIEATTGVRQGDNLAPVLFLIYIQAVL
jgi:hypothetical protein